MHFLSYMMGMAAGNLGPGWWDVETGILKLELGVGAYVLGCPHHHHSSHGWLWPWPLTLPSADQPGFWGHHVAPGLHCDPYKPHWAQSWEMWSHSLETRGGGISLVVQRLRPVLPMQGLQVQALGREPDPHMLELRVHMPQLKVLRAATKSRYSQIKLVCVNVRDESVS